MKKASEVERAAVLGSGTMGHGIAHVLALAGIETRLYDVAQGFLDQALQRIRGNLDVGVEKKKVAPEARERALAYLSVTTELGTAIRGVDLVIEAVPETLALKRELFGELGRSLGAEVLLATNTSSLSVAKIAEAARDPERVLGMHFFNPVHVMKLVEVVQAPKSSAEAVALALELARRMGKDPIRVQDSPGFASSRLGLVLGLEAIRMVEAGVATPQDIDKAMKLGYGFPMGPLELTDLVGLDVRLSIAEVLAQEIGARFEPPQLLREKVARGELGKKSGRGFYAWD